MLEFETHIRDPIHGFIGVTAEELRLLDSRAMQRLRSIRQLATAYLVYPGCNHTRFEHSLGVMHIADRIASSLIDQCKNGLFSEEAFEGNPDDFRKKVRFAALLHDIGHPPFCHVTEPIFKMFSSATLEKEGIDTIHEKITQEIILQDQNIVEVLGEYKDSVLEILHGKDEKEPFLARQIISGPLDADKQDYLLRDSYFAGVKYGIFDLDNLIRGLTALEIPIIRGYSIACRGESVKAVEQFLAARYFISEQVYYHKVRIACDAMIQRGLRLAKDLGNGDIYDQMSSIFTFQEGNEAYIKEYLSWDDYSLMSFFLRQDNKIGEIFNRIRDRKLFKQRLELYLMDFEGQIKFTPLYRLRVEDKESIKLSTKIGIEFKRDPDFVIVNTHAEKFPEIHYDPESIINEKDIIVIQQEEGKILKGIFKGISDPPKRFLVIMEDDNDVETRTPSGEELTSALREFIMKGDVLNG